MVRLVRAPPAVRFAFGTSAGFEELPVMLKLAEGVSASETVKAMAPLDVSSLMVRSAMAEILGNGSTVTVKAREKVLLRVCPSFAVTVMTDVPLTPGAGRKVSVPVPAGLL